MFTTNGSAKLQQRCQGRLVLDTGDKHTGRRVKRINNTVTEWVNEADTTRQVSGMQAGWVVALFPNTA